MPRAPCGERSGLFADLFEAGGYIYPLVTTLCIVMEYPPESHHAVAVTTLCVVTI